MSGSGWTNATHLEGKITEVQSTGLDAVEVRLEGRAIRVSTVVVNIWRISLTPWVCLHLIRLQNTTWSTIAMIIEN